ncbi:plasminogen-like [Mercenaria mercenaria]|uniref:plasminogen-like n=1 Tax=Mercenaria mercenaria TaxID=6596 RepID=UPI00234E9E41|nr:plasminogen-like [Mercenaria mercenaria]
MEETTLEYSLLKIDGKENRKDAVRSVKGSGRISVQKSTLYVIIIIVSVSFVGSEILWYLMYNRNNNCNFVIPEGYELTARRNNPSGTTLPHTVQEMTKTFHTGTTDKLTTMQSGQEGTSIKGATTVSKKQTTTEYSGCPTNWLTYGQSCYYFSNESVRWLEAMIRCQQLGGYLAEINTTAENQFLRTYAKQIDDIECFQTTSRKYQGLQNTTVYGHICQRWDSQQPHSHTRNRIEQFPERTIADAANYCRDPDGEGLPWCYTTDPDTRWQFCGINKCPGGNWWVGLVVIEEKWKWMTTQTNLDKSYTNWGQDEPLKRNRGLCGSFMGALDFAWKAQYCDWPAMYLCEK